MVDVTRQIAYIGRAASEQIQQPATAFIGGRTSRGIFINLPGERIVFVSGETWRGPLTLNLVGELGNMHRLKTRAEVHIEPGELHFPTIDLKLAISPAQIWEAAPPPESVLSAAERAARLEAITQAIGRSRELNVPEAAEALNLRRAVKANTVDALAAALDAFLGLGPGLTPSGDDFVIGVILALSRWGPKLLPDLDADRLFESVIPAACRKTTTLSANLIGCAAQGQADERLLAALDGFMTGAPDVGSCAAGLSSWGSTSGIAALAGMGLVI